MQNDGHDAPDAIHAPGSQREDTSNKPQLNAKMVRRLQKLAPLRIDPALIKFTERAPVFEGGYAIVSPAILSSRSDGTKGRVVESKGTNVKSRDRIANLEGDGERRDAGGSNNDADDVAQEGSEGPAQESDGETSGRRKAVAVKKMKVKSPDELLRVLSLTLREAEVLANLSHENIIKLEGFVEDVSKEVIWLVFPWEDNGNLKDFVAVFNWEIPERIALIYDVASGVEYLHTRTPPICHADLKSINILVNSEFRALITDFGSAHHPEANRDNEERKGAINQPQPVPSVEATFCTATNTITLTGIQCTTRWAAPEVLKNDEFSLASDIWALGWVAYEVMTNYIPFHDVKEAMVVRRVVQGDLPSISNDVRMLLMQALCTIVGQCWNIDPGKRPKAKDCRDSIHWMPMVAPNQGRTKDTTGFVYRSAELLIKLGEMHQTQSDYRSALNYFTEALDVCIDRGDRGGEAYALLELAQIHGLQQRYSEAITPYTKALEIHTDLGNKRGRADALWGLAQVHRLRNEYSQAVTLLSECLQIRTDIGDRIGRADALWGLAEVHRARNEYTQAVTFYSESLQIRTDIGDRQWRASALWGLAEVHRARNEYTQAVTFYSESLLIRNDIGDREGRAEALWGLAQMHLLRKEYSQAVPLYSECLQIWTDIGTRGNTPYALWGLASAHLSRRESSQAFTMFSECLQISTDIGDREARASALWGLASVHQARNEYTQAFTLYSECLQIRTDLSDQRGRAEALCGLAQVHRLQNEYTAALALCSEALEISTNIGDRYFRAFTLQCMADVYRDQHDPSTAIHQYDQAAEIYNQIGHALDEATALKEAAELRRFTDS